MDTGTKNSITGKEGGPIGLSEAAAWTKNYRDKFPDETISQFFGKEILQSTLAQGGCMGIRFYYAYDTNGAKHLIITGVNADGTDQIAGSLDIAFIAEAAGGGGGGIGDQSTPCPGTPGCPQNVLTGG
jgi:hypothetical protein